MGKLWMALVGLGLLCVLVTAVDPVTSEDDGELTRGPITLRYPDTVSVATAQAVLDLQQDALSEVGRTLGVTSAQSLTVSLSRDCNDGGCSLFGQPYATPGKIYYGLPPVFFAKRDRLIEAVRKASVHEMTHAVALRHLAGATEPFDEGLATAVAALSEGQELLEPHLISAGLQQDDLLVDTVALFGGAVDGRIYVYKQAGSFLLFLMDRYGMGKVKRFFDAANELSVMAPAYLEGIFPQVFGRSADQLESEWKAFLTRYTDDERERARLLWKAHFDELREARPVRLHLSDLYGQGKRAGRDASTASPSVQRVAVIEDLPTPLYRQMKRTWDAQDRLLTVRSKRVAAAYESYRQQLDHWVRDLRHWSDAARAFQRGLHLLDQGGESSQVLEQLSEARRLYDEVGDRAMATKVGTYIESVDQPH